MSDTVIRCNIFSFSDIAVMIATIAQGSGGGGGSAYERGGDARRRFWIKPLKETDLGDLGVAQAFFDP